MKQCPQCNFTCNDNDIVCKNCGYLFGAANFADSEAPKPQDQPQTPPPQQPYQPQPSQPSYQQPYQPQPDQQQAYQQQAYQQQAYQQYPPVYPQKTSGVTIAGFVLSLVSVVLAYPCSGGGLLLAIPGLIMSIVSLSRIKKRGEKGNGLAIAGIICGALGIVAGIAVLIFVINMINSPEYQNLINQILQQAGSSSSQ